MRTTVLAVACILSASVLMACREDEPKEEETGSDSSEISGCRRTAGIAGNAGNAGGSGRAGNARGGC